MTESPDDPGGTRPLDRIEQRLSEAEAGRERFAATLEHIEQTRRKAEANGELVALLYGWKVRRRFARYGPLPGGGEYKVTIRMEAGRPLVESLTLTPDPPVQHVTFPKSSDIVDEAVRAEALAMTVTAWSEPDIVQQFDRALVVARRARHRRLTPEFLREVLDQYNDEYDGGIAAVVRKQCTSERNAYRWLALAKEELQ